MMVRLLLLPFLLLMICRCGNNQQGLILENDSRSFKLAQRTAIEIPGYNRNIEVEIDDITNGSTFLTIHDKNEMLVQELILPEKEIAFLFDGEAYIISCTRMNNRLIGNDDASFTIRKRGTKPAAILTAEKQKIEQLIKTVAASDVIFIRNGEEYGATEAAEHLYNKWQQAGDEIKTLDDFIEKIASRSSASGEPYQIKLKTGEIVPAKTWMQEQAKNL